MGDMTTEDAQHKVRALFFAAHDRRAPRGSYENANGWHIIDAGLTGVSVGPDGWCEIFDYDAASAADGIDATIAAWSRRTNRDHDRVLRDYRDELARLRVGGPILLPAPAP